MRFFLPTCLCLAGLLASPALAQQSSPRITPRISPGGAGFGATQLPPGLPGTPANDGDVGSPQWAQRMQQQNRQLDTIGRRLLEDERQDSAGHYRDREAGEAWPTE